MIHFPRLRRESTFDTMPLMLFSGMASVAFLWMSWIVSVIVAIPFLICYLLSMRLDLSNNRLRRQWAEGYSLRLTSIELHAKLRLEPERYLVHLGTYTGFDTVHLKPVCILEDRVTGELAALPRASVRLPRLCEQLGVEITQTPVSPFPPA